LLLFEGSETERPEVVFFHRYQSMSSHFSPPLNRRKSWAAPGHWAIYPEIIRCYAKKFLGLRCAVAAAAAAAKDLHAQLKLHMQNKS
jgi:hypothetical protein